MFQPTRVLLLSRVKVGGFTLEVDVDGVESVNPTCVRLEPEEKSERFVTGKKCPRSHCMTSEARELVRYARKFCRAEQNRTCLSFLPRKNASSLLRQRIRLFLLFMNASQPNSIFRPTHVHHWHALKLGYTRDLDEIELVSHSYECLSRNRETK